MKLRKVFPIIAMLLVVFMASCNKKDDITGPPPKVTSTNPINNATSIAINSKISAIFSVAMDPSTITTANFALQQGTEPVSGAAEYTGTTATFTPAANLATNTIYTATITTGAKDESGKSMAKDYIWSFTTGGPLDITRPTVTLTDPANSATGVTLNKLIVITFSKPMDQTTITSLTYTLKQELTPVSGAVTYTGTKATFTPASNLVNNKIYTGTITTGAKDMAGNALASNYTFSFTTGEAPDIILPRVNSTDPLNHATGVALSKVISATFSEAMNPVTITTSSFTLMIGTTAVPGTVAYSGTTATFTPSNVLALSTEYTATITIGAKDLADNALAANTVWTFSTGSTLSPTVISTDPAINATDVVLNKTLTATFSEAMDPLTIIASTFTLKQGTTPVAGVVTYTGTTASFTPSSALTLSTIYTGTITTGAKNVPGTSLANDYVWSFTTASATSGLAVVDLGTAGNYVILAKTAISNIPTSAVTGDLGLSPAATSFVTGFPLTNATGYATSPEVTGKIYAATMAEPTPTNLTTAIGDMETAYTDAAGRPSPDFTELGTGNIGGLTLTPGLYKWTSAVTIPTDITISGSATDVWIFQIAMDLTMSSAVKITLSGGALAKNIFWQVAGVATLGTTSHFEGIILSKTGITFQTGASINGRALAQTAVILDGNVVTQPQ